jgi:hypothetical protein
MLHGSNVVEFTKKYIVAALIVLASTPAAMAQYFPPIAHDDQEFVEHNTPALFNVLENDIGFEAPLDPTSVEIILEPLHGVAYADPETGEIVYLPDVGYGGPDELWYTVKDAYGVVSNYAVVAIDVEPNAAPVIEGFSVYRGQVGFWHFVGTVVDEDPEGLVVQFGGLLQGESVVVKADGSFHFVILLQPGQAGRVWAQTVDQHGLESNIVYDVVDN